jgi:hypothetical protein
MLYGNAALHHTGMPLIHRDPIQDVSNRTGHAIIFRAVGTQSTQLLVEGYAAKGFRIDTKSCDWGPMRGFVCVDPRLSKVGGDIRGSADNQRYTVEALEGRVRHDAIGGLRQTAVGHHVVMRDWMASCKPVVISGNRYNELLAAGLVGHTDHAGAIRGVSTDRSTHVQFPWALMPIARCATTPAYVAACGTTLPAGGYGVFVDHTNADVPFAQFRPAVVTGITVDGYDAVMGLINPGSENHGYRACVTGDYDLFAVWRPEVEGMAFRARRNMDLRIVDRVREESPLKRDAHEYQHYKLGNISPRLEMIKVLLNSALIGGGGFPGGNLVHHSDEVGNPSPGLRKSLQQSFPLLAFVPDHLRSVFRPALTEPALGIRNTLDFADFTRDCRNAGIVPDLREEWSSFGAVRS